MIMSPEQTLLKGSEMTKTTKTAKPVSVAKSTISVDGKTVVRTVRKIVKEGKFYKGFATLNKVAVAVSRPFRSKVWSVVS